MSQPIFSTILMVFAFVLFAIAAFLAPAEPNPQWRRLVAAGLACWSLAIVLSGWHL